MKKKERISMFLKEVSEHPEFLHKLVVFYRGLGKARLEAWARLARTQRRIIFAGMGTSEFAPDAVMSALAQQGIDASALNAGEWLHYPRTNFGLTVLISQSGESIETRKLAEKLMKKNDLVAITNNETSSLARATKLVLPMVAGQEMALSSKTYVNTLAVLYLMARVLEGKLSLEQGLKHLDKAAETMAAVDHASIARAAHLLANASVLHFIARGPAVAAAKQAALAFIEGARISATAYTGGAFRHGPLELADQSLHCVFFIPEGLTRRLLETMAAEVLKKGSRVVVITDTDVNLRGTHACILKVPKFGEELFPLSAVMTQELVLQAVAAARGIEAGRFRYGQKVTTRE